MNKAYLEVAGVALAVMFTGSLQAQSRMAGIESLKLASIPGEMQTFYSPDAAARAHQLQTLLEGELLYYAAIFHVRFEPVDMAVLDEKQWPAVAGQDPYGMPSVDGSNPAVFVMPSSWEPVTWMPFPKREKVPPAVLRRALVNGRSWEQIKFEGGDGIGTHEIGHAIIRQLAIDPQTHWFSEFLASYVGYAYLKATRPMEALSSEIFWTQGLDAPHPFTKLDEFESKYDELMQKHPANYGWYQLTLDQRVIDIYRQRGVDYIRTIRASFPAGAPKLDSSQMLDKLELITPGWKAWAAHVESGEVAAVRLGLSVRTRPRRIDSSPNSPR